MVDPDSGGCLWAADNARYGLTRTGHHADSPYSYFDTLGGARPGNGHADAGASPFSYTIAGAAIADGHSHISARSALNGGGRCDAGTHGG